MRVDRKLLWADHGRIGAKAIYLHLGIAVLFVPLVIADGRHGVKDMYSGKPRWVVRSVQALGLVFFVVFVAFLTMTHAASPEIVNGEYVLNDHGRIVGYISQHRYLVLKGWELRMFACVWIFFYYAIAVHWWFPRQNEWNILMPEKRGNS